MAPISLILAVLLVSCNIVNSQYYFYNYRSFFNNFNSYNPMLRDTTGCLTGQFYDRINRDCYDIPQVCPAGSTVDSTVGCTCPFGQLWNHVRGQCDDTTNTNNNNDNPGQHTELCPIGQYYDRINDDCYNLPKVCPSGTTRNDSVGCLCPPGQLYNGLDTECQDYNSSSTSAAPLDTTDCLTGQFYDKINNNCYNNPEVCPEGSTVDSTVGCTCPSGQLYNYLSGNCEDYSPDSDDNTPVLRDTTGCLTGQFYDRINRDCYDIPRVCPAGSTVDSTVGCTCPSGQLWNHVRGQCVPTIGK